jgi:hypothetical protein
VVNGADMPLSAYLAAEPCSCLTQLCFSREATSNISSKRIQVTESSYSIQLRGVIARDLKEERGTTACDLMTSKSKGLSDI